MAWNRLTGRSSGPASAGGRILRLTASSVGPRRPTAFQFAVAVLLGAGLALRILTLVGYSPGNVSHPDTASYVDAAAHSLFANPFRPAGYALFLRLLHGLSHELWFTIAVQHLVGLGTAGLAYLICRQLGARRAVSLIPAAAVLLSGDQLYLEYSLLSDGLFLALALLACSLGLSVPRSAHSDALALAAAAATALSATVRTVGVALVPVLVVWLLLYGPEGPGRRVAAAAAVTAVCVAVLGGYAIAQRAQTGVFGLSRFGAWPLYARVAPIADCRRFKPPPDTWILCDGTPVAQRPGPDFYLWNMYSPAERYLGFPPSHDTLVGAFARSVIVHEPLAYLLEVTRDLARYVDPSLVTRELWGTDWRGMALNQPWDTPDAFGLPGVTSYYRHVHLHVRPGLMNALEVWRSLFRIHGALIALSALLCAAGLFWSPDRRTSRGIVLIAGFAAALFVVPTATMSYEARYGVPGGLLLLIGAARGAELVAVRLRVMNWPRRAALRPAEPSRQRLFPSTVPPTETEVTVSRT